MKQAAEAVEDTEIAAASYFCASWQHLVFILKKKCIA